MQDWCEEKLKLLYDTTDCKVIVSSKNLNSLKQPTLPTEPPAMSNKIPPPQKVPLFSDEEWRL